MISIVIAVVMAVIIGFIGDAIAGDKMPGGVFGSMIAGFAGVWLGTLLFGRWGPVIAGFPIIPAILGAMIFVFLIGMLARSLNRTT